MIVGGEASKNGRASAQGLYNLVSIGLGVIVGNYFAGQVYAANTVTVAGEDVTNYQGLFAVPMFVTIGCLVLLLAFYPSKSRST